MCQDFALTPLSPDHSISPESSDGFASVGTILPKEKAALLPGGLFVSKETIGQLQKARLQATNGLDRLFRRRQLYWLLQGR
jgi:hypothetical protein